MFIVQPAAPVTRRGTVVLWLAFSTLNLLGAIATLMPHLCSPHIQVDPRLDPSRYTHLWGLRLIHGHHPECREFESHEFQFSGRRICAGCTGLFLGALISVTVSLKHMTLGFSGLPTVYGFLGVTAIVAVLGSLVLVSPSRPLVRAVQNFVLVLGFSLVLISVEVLGGFFRGGLVVGLCVVWMSTRIQISRWSHDRVCSGCVDACGKKEVLL
jgi:hypothetical protein